MKYHIGIAAAFFTATSIGAQAAPIEWSLGDGGNGHSYEIVLSTLDWTQARDAAAARGGYLATITSGDEQAFLDNLYTPRSVYDDGTTRFSTLWLGGSDAGVEGEWRWRTGPEAGSLMSSYYTNWGSSEPNDFGAGEDYLGGWFLADEGSEWNDLPEDIGPEARGYVVEYDEIEAGVIPLPATLPLLLGGVGLVGFVGRRRR